MVCDATVLERNLNLVLQITQITERVVVCANLMDEARRKRIEVDQAELERELGVPVVMTAAREGQGLDELVERIHAVASGELRVQPTPVTFDAEFESAVAELAGELAELLPGRSYTRWLAARLLDGDERIREALRTGELARS